MISMGAYELKVYAYHISMNFMSRQHALRNGFTDLAISIYQTPAHYISKRVPRAFLSPLFLMESDNRFCMSGRVKFLTNLLTWVLTVLGT